jgi:serine/threonine-protein kinase
MGEVYRAQDVRMQRPVALKLLHAAFTQDLEALARFSREASNASKINNQHVVQVYDCGETQEGIPYIAMEFVDGRSLRTLLNAEGPLEPSRAVDLISQIAKGLEGAHRLENPVVHRDLKPDNILVTTDVTGAELAKVADFGISKAVRGEGQQVTKTGFVAGTCEFMSPEQVTGGKVDLRTDIYALALMTFMMLTGKLPFLAQTPEHSMGMRLSEAPRTLKDMAPEVEWPEELQALLDAALSKSPSGRPGSAGEFATCLARAMEAWKGGLVEPPEETPGRGRGYSPLLWVGAATAIVVIGAGIFSLLPIGKKRATSVHAPENPKAVKVDTQEIGVGPVTPIESLSAAHDQKHQVPVLPTSRQDVDTNRSIVDTNRSIVDTNRSIVDTNRSIAEGKHPPKPREHQPARALASYDTILHIEMPRDSALAALKSLTALMAHLTTARDSVEADIYRAEANALAGHEAQACALLEAAKPRATSRQRQKIQLWVDQGICPNLGG